MGVLYAETYKYSVWQADGSNHGGVGSYDPEIGEAHGHHVFAVPTTVTGQNDDDLFIAVVMVPPAAPAEVAPELVLIG